MVEFVIPPVAVSNGEVILIAVAIAIPLAALAFALGSGNAFKQIGKGSLSLEMESDAPQGMRDSGAEAGGDVSDAEVRQLLEAKAYRQRARGEQPLDVEAEIERLGKQQAEVAARADEAGLREEVRQLVVARNERRRRQGKQPLDVEAEIERQLRELDDLS